MAVDPKTLATIAQYARKGYDWLASKNGKENSGKNNKFVIIAGIVIFLLLAVSAALPLLLIVGFFLIFVGLLFSPILVCLGLLIAVILIISTFVIPIWYPVVHWEWPPWNSWTEWKCYELRVGDEFLKALGIDAGELQKGLDEAGIKGIGVTPAGSPESPVVQASPTPMPLDGYKEIYEDEFSIIVDSVKKSLKFGKDKWKTTTALYCALLFTSKTDEGGYSTAFSIDDINKDYLFGGDPSEYAGISLEPLFWKFNLYQDEPFRDITAYYFKYKRAFIDSALSKPYGDSYDESWPAICTKAYSAYTYVNQFLSILENYIVDRNGTLEIAGYFPFGNEYKISRSQDGKWYQFPNKSLFKEEYLQNRSALLFAARNTPVLAPENCIVARKGYTNEFGNFIILKSKETFSYQNNPLLRCYNFFNLQNSPNYDKNQEVAAGTTIGYVGSSGNLLYQSFLISNTNKAPALGFSTYWSDDANAITATSGAVDSFLVLKLNEQNKYCTPTPIPTPEPTPIPTPEATPTP